MGREWKEERIDNTDINIYSNGRKKNDLLMPCPHE